MDSILGYPGAQSRDVTPGDPLCGEVIEFLIEFLFEGGLELLELLVWLPGAL